MEIYCRVLETEDSRVYRELRLEGKNSIMLGAFIDRELIGLCGLIPATSTQVEIIQMYVVNKNRGRGIAFKLVNL